MSADAEKIEELSAIIKAVRERVRARYPHPADGDAGDAPGIRIAVADLLPIVHARDAAQAKIASIGSVNPRAGGVVNSLIQAVKKTIARALGWFVRDQVTFNRETIAAVEAILEALNEHNRILVSLAGQTDEQIAATRQYSDGIRQQTAVSQERQSEQIGAFVRRQTEELGEVRAQAGALQAEAVELKDVRRHWIEWRADWERRLSVNEVQFLRSVADLQGAFQHRSTLADSNFREMVRAQHADYLGALDRATLDIQKRLWADLEKIRADYERLIHIELRLIRQRALAPPPADAPLSEAPPVLPGFDYQRFAERFRGSEEYVRRNQEFYKPLFAGCESVLDIGCGRGEFMESMRELGVAARGIDLSEESVEQCRQKGLAAERANLFAYLAAQPDGEFDGIFSSQVVEHLAPEALPAMVRLCAAKLRRGGVLAIETPNPECLAIFATHFYLDPTHTRPVPHQLMAFYMEEAGLGLIAVHPLSPAVESFPEIAELPEGFREKFFGGLDYAITGRRL